MNQKPITAVIFDLDNTLVASKKLQECRENRDIGSFDKLIQSVQLFQPVKKILDEIKKSKIPIAIVTNSPRWYTERLLNHFNLTHYFSVIVTYNEVSRDYIKPSPKGIEIALEKLKLKASHQVLYIGDEEKDFIAAYYAGIKPIAPSWATRAPISLTPATILNSKALLQCLPDTYNANLIAECVALHKSFDFEKQQLNFIPLNEEGQVTALERDEIKVIALGRYFSKKSFLTYSYHENHPLSLDISSKEESSTYVVPNYYVDLLVHACEKISDYFFDKKDQEFDIITVIPSKKGKNPRLENMLRRIQSKSQLSVAFIQDLFEFKEGAQSMKSAGAFEHRYNEIKDSLLVKKKYLSTIKDKNILIIDDVTTTSATLKYARQILNRANAKRVLGLCLAKTVSILDQKLCRKCFAPLRIRKNKRTGIPFYGCSNYHEKQCTFVDAVRVKDCPKCGDSMIIRPSKKDSSRFLGCATYPKCSHTESYVKNDF